MKYFIFIIFFLCSLNLLSQTLNLQYEPYNSAAETYGAATNYLPIDLNSDFGRRVVSSGTLWHPGIDFNTPVRVDEGDHILNPVAGQSTVQLICRSGTFLILYLNGAGHHDFGYGHIFQDDIPAAGLKVGDMVIKYMDGDNARVYAILDLTNESAISHVAGNVTYTDDNGVSTTYPVTTVVNSGDILAPVGGSGGFAGAEHLHLYRPRNIVNVYNTYHWDPDNVSDPLEYLQVLEDHPGYTLSIQNLNNLTSFQNANSFYSGSSKGSVQVRVAMTNATSPENTFDRYDNTFMHVDNVLLYIKNHNLADDYYKLFVGPQYNSKISLGARELTERYPENIDEVIGSNTNTGMVAYAYRSFDPIRPYDEFFFSDVFTRIHKDHIQGTTPVLYAQTNDMARYPDGHYDLDVKVFDVNNQLHPEDFSNNPLAEIVIDNFRPFITKLEVLNPDLIYGYEWKRTVNGNELLFNESGSFAAINNSSPVTIKFWTSEPLMEGNGIIISWPTVAINGDEANYKSNTDGTYWEYEIPANAFSSANISDISIIGSDLNGNALIDMPNDNRSIAISNMPVRTGADFSNPLALSDDETIIIVSCTTQPESQFSAEISDAELPYTVTFDNQSTGDVTSYTWDFGLGSTFPDEDPVFEYKYSGSHNVSLTTNNCMGEHTITKPNYINVLPAYISSLEIVQDGDVVQEYTREYNSTSESFSFANTGSFAEEDEDLVINVTTSLPLFRLTLQITDENGQLLFSNFKIKESNKDTKTWTFTIPAEKGFFGPRLNLLKFSGKDYSDNDLLRQKEPYDPPVLIDATGTGWNTNLDFHTGVDDNYYLYVKTTTAATEAQSLIRINSCDYDRIVIINNEDATFTVDFDNGTTATLSPYSFIDHTYLGGVHNIKLLQAGEVKKTWNHLSFVH